MICDAMVTAAFTHRNGRSCPVVVILDKPHQRIAALHDHRLLEYGKKIKVEQDEWLRWNMINYQV